MAKRLELPKFQAFADTAPFLSGGKVWTYEVGTSTPKASYTTPAGDVENANPVILDSRGEADIYLKGKYKINILDEDDVQISGWPVDNVEGGLGEGAMDDYYYPDATAADQGVTGNSDTIKYAVDTISTDIGTIYLRHNSGNATTTYTLTTSEVLPAGIKIALENGAIIDGAGTLTLDNPEQLDAPPTQQIFGSSITLAFTNPGTAYLEWRGLGAGATDSKDAFDLFIAAFPTAGGTIQMLGGTYTTSGINVNSVDNIKIFGSGPMTTLRPYWPGGAYDEATYGNETFNVQDGGNFEVAYFKYDGRYSDGLATVTYPRFLTTFNNVGDPADDISVHHIYGFNGGDLQDRAFCSFYDSKNIHFDHNTVLDFDVGALFSLENCENAIATNNIIIGGKSEAISLYEDDASTSKIHDRRVVVSNNILLAKAASAVNVSDVTAGNIVISDNIMGTTTKAAVQYEGKGIVLQDCNNVHISNNTFTGPGQFIYISGSLCDNLTVVNNKIKWSESFINNDITATVNNWNISSNTIEGSKSAPAHDNAVTYRPGEFVSSGGNYYYCILESLNHAPPNATYWTAFTGLTHFNGYFDTLVFNSNLFTDIQQKAFLMTAVNHASIYGNRVVNGDDWCGLGNDATLTIDDVQFIGNSIEVANASDPALKSTSLWLKNSVFSDNYFKTAAAWDTVLFSNHAIQNTSFENNTIDGAHAGEGYAETYGTLRKRGNTLVESVWSDNDVPTSGYVNIGETFYKTDPSAGGTMGSVCTTAGYAFKEAYNAANAYVTGEHVQGSDSKVYKCILDDSGDADHDPITGGTWSTYWVLVSATLAVMKTFGAITA